MSGERILIVEDERIIAKGIKQQVQQLGYDVSGLVASGEAAIEHAGEYHPDMALIDIYLAGAMDGIEAAKQLQSRFGIPILYLTALTDNETLQRAKITEPAAYIIKPVQDRELHIAIEIALYKHKTEHELRQHREYLEELIEERTAKLQQEIEVRKAVEARLYQAKLEAERANRLKSAFLANMSHDIRTPMNAIMGFSEILKDRLRDFPQYETYLNGIIRGGESLLRLIDDILDLSKIEANRLDLQPDTIHLHSFLAEIRQMFSIEASQKGLHWDIRISPDVPAAAQLDGDRLRQILVNLVDNAMKFTEKGGVTLRVEVKGQRAEVKGEEQEEKTFDPSPLTFNLQFEISDTGIGISVEDLDQIFEAFSQAKHAAQSSGGTGLGLAITKRLVEMMNGSIAVESEIKKGTVFRVVLHDVSIAKAEAEAERVAGKDEVREIGKFHGATLLLVEDNDSNRAVIRELLALYDFLIIEAENGQAALQKLQLRYPDIILMDIHMPMMDGNTATREIRKIEEQNQASSRTPIIALTAYALKQQRDEYQELYDAYLVKPISKDKLLTTLSRFLPHTTKPGRCEADSPSTEAIPIEFDGLRTGIASSLKSAQEEYCEALKAHMTHIETIPQPLFEALHDDLLSRHREVSGVMSADGLIAFSNAVIEVADSFEIPPLKAYGEALRDSVTVFNILRMKQLLAQFPEIVEIITNNK